MKGETMTAKVAFLCTGIMGAPMARNLLRAGHSVAVWNRTADKAEALRPDGAEVFSSAADAVCGRDFVFVMAADGPACDAILFGESQAADAMSPGATVVVSASIPPATARAQAGECAKRGLGYVDAPVSGGERGAVAGTLAVMAGGSETDFAKAEPVLRAVGTPVYVGPAGCGQLAKLANQAVVGATVAVVAEALLLAEKGGADPAAVRRALLGGFADSTVLRQHGERMLRGDFAPGGPAKYQLKDLRTVLAEADDVGTEVSCAGAAAELFSQMVGAGMGEMDHGAVYLFLKNRAAEKSGATAGTKAAA